MSEYLSHFSVMLKECLEALEKGHKDSGAHLFADLTFGAGGHTFAISDKFPEGVVYSTDQDPDALRNGHEQIKARAKEDKVNLLAMNFEQFPAWCEENNMHGKFAGVLMDLGVSSHQFDKMERGFSFRADAPLDMRMNYTDDSIPTAADLLNTLSESEIADILFTYGEERLSRRIAAKICEERKLKPLSTTGELENIIFHCYPAKDRHGRIHPATRSFQALRIAVNEELKVLENTIAKLLPFLAPGGVLAIISFHSLEDRIVKHTYKEMMENSEFPATILTKKPMTATEEELSQNSRSRSAKLRLLQRDSQLGRVDGLKKKKYYKNK
ncbi:MAG TPA: 16S rRNA (cytosine(1402)-N(4))-methyltransferase RsmH [Bacteriovoracaceae bacterium]|nr:16S rRNA (cytosine(1402)-N(4))-methyltransferase RsmH [Bacteriovoracaceae bacterium]